MMNHHVSGHSPHYNAKAAVSVLIDNSHDVPAHKLRYCLNERLGVGVPIVQCRLHNRSGLSGSEYYVELSTRDFRRRLLEFNGAEMTCAGMRIRPTIRPWDRDQPSSPSHSSGSWHNQSNASNQHHYRPSAQDAEAAYRPSKRPRENNTTFEPRSPTPSPMGMRRQSSIGSSVSSQMSDCLLMLKKNPPSFSPQTFQDYLNSHLTTLKLPGVLDDAGGGPPIQRCYESKANIVDFGWVLETRTAKIADSIINSVSGKLLVEGTRLYFQRDVYLSTDGKVYQAKWSNNRCKVFVSELPNNMSQQEFCVYVNSSFREAKIYDRDAVCAASMMKGNKVCVLLCPSPELAQRVVDELDNVSLHGITLRVQRHKHSEKSDAAVGKNTNKNVPSSTARRVSVVTGETLPNTIPNTRSPHTSSEESTSETVDTNRSVAETESAKLKAANEKLTKQVFKLLKENKDLKKDKENLGKEVAARKEKDAVDSETNKKKYNDLKRKHDEVSSELENLHTKKLKVDEELVAFKSESKKLKSRLENESKADYEKRLYDVHESWKEQSIQIQDQGEEIERLKVEKAKEATEKEELQARLTEKEQKYQSMTDALVNLSAVLNEEKAIRKQLQQTLVEFRKQRKKAERMLKTYQQANGYSEEHSDPGDSAVKPEDQYDF